MFRGSQRPGHLPDPICSLVPATVEAQTAPDQELQ
ncbi:MAG: hypothetical protein AVDCRST_MAG83-2471 [uncultured Arthrobacter sp.]|uniref:Uncharacterized protein n=1 Tax=uncultured Arthrobacter sp. TaxID=114050 RepID=A0A6J4IMK4_9MICC|nr:MAG: hypothetical protein AVDCRST_MAG83-2471 [uncultured Arthrobacter sp.]